MNSSIFQHLPDACPLRMLTDKTNWRVCMKHVSKDSPALCNNNMNGVGLGTSGKDAEKKHFFFFDSVPTIPPDTNFYKDYETVMGINNFTNKAPYKLLQIIHSLFLLHIVNIRCDYLPIFFSRNSA